MGLIKQVGIDASCDRNVLVSQCLSDVEQGDLRVICHACEGVPQPVDRNRRQPALLDQKVESLGDLVWMPGEAVLPRDDVSAVLKLIGGQGQHLLVSFLAVQGLDKIVQARNRQGTDGMGCFGLLFHNLAAGRCAYNADPYDVFSKINVLPFQAADFAPAQAKIACQLDNHLQPAPLHKLKKPAELLRIIVELLWCLQVGGLHPVNRIFGQQVLPESGLQRGVQQDVVLMDGIGAELLAPHHFCVVGLNLLGGQLLQPDCPQFRDQVVLDDAFIAVAGRPLAVRLYNLIEPIGKPVLYRHLRWRRTPVLEVLHLKTVQRLSSPIPLLKGLCTPDPVAVPILPVVEIRIIQLFLIIIRQVLFNSFS